MAFRKRQSNVAVAYLSRGDKSSWADATSQGPHWLFWLPDPKGTLVVNGTETVPGRVDWRAQAYWIILRCQARTTHHSEGRQL
jgi:hypothetical protein